MKTQIRIIFILVISAMALYGCEEDSEDLLKDLAEGKMVVVVNKGDEVVLDCSFGQYGGTGGMTGEVFLTAFLQSGEQHKHFQIMYGSYNNSIPFTTKTYTSNGAEGSGVMVNCWVGFAEDDAVMTVKIISVSETAIKGEMEGTVKDEEGVKSTIKGAFWAKRQTEN